MTDHNEIDDVSGKTTTGHEWDGIKELNTPLPRWWVLTFYAVHRLGDRVLDRVSGMAAGCRLYDRRAALFVPRGRRRRAWQSREDPRRQDGALGAASLADIEKDPALLALARARGKTVFGDNCAPCHGSGARRRQGLSQPERRRLAVGRHARPDHADDPVRCALRAIRRPTKARCCVRQGRNPEKGRDRHGRQLCPVAVRAADRQGYDAAAGAKIFADNCAACHGDAGKGNQELGAPNLTDKIWLYGSDEATIIETITNGRAGVMPAWVGRLDPIHDQGDGGLCSLARRGEVTAGRAGDRISAGSFELDQLRVGRRV